MLYAILTPLFTFRFGESFLDPYYAKLGPRNLALSKIGIANAEVTQDVDEKTYMYYLGLGVGAEDSDGNGATWQDGANSKYNVVLRIKEEYKFINKTQRVIGIESYLAKGFIYMQIPAERYDEIIAWEEKNGLKVIYPAIDTANGYCADSENANYWYKMDSKITPISTKTGEDVAITLANKFGVGR